MFCHVSPGVGSRAEGIQLREPGHIDFWREELPVSAQGDGIYLCTRIDHNCHQFCTVLCGKLEPGAGQICNGQ